MRGILITLAGLGLAVAGPVAAQGTDTPKGGVAAGNVACTAHAADWQMDGADPPGLKGQVDIPKGTSTGIFGCAVGGHAVRINIAAWPIPTYHCGVSSDIEVSAWVDGVRVVTRRQAGDYLNCMDDPDSDWQLWRVLVNDRMHLTTCERRIDSARDTPYAAAELKAGETSLQGVDENGGTIYTVSRCTLTPVSPTAGSHDPYFDGKAIHRTPPAIELSNGDAEVCRALTPAMNAIKPDALRSVLEGQAVTHTTGNGKPYDTADQADRDTGEIATYRLDVDNDGTMDTVTYRDISQMGKDDEVLDFPGQYSWTSGKSGKTVDLGASLLGGMIWTSQVYTDPVRDDTRFIAAGGRIYFYKADNLLVGSFINGDVTEVEIVDGASQDADEPSRHLYELHSDGKAIQVCGWRARKRPEEFL